MQCDVPHFVKSTRKLLFKSCSLLSYRFLTSAANFANALIYTIALVAMRDSNTVLLLFKTFQANVLSPLERQACGTA